jgi:sugar lactone lactonase YvrE
MIRWLCSPGLLGRFAVVFLVIAPPLVAQVASESYRVESIDTPPGRAPEVSALTFDADGRLFIGLRLGTLWSLDPKTRAWSQFASGLHWPLGMIPGRKGEIIVAQVPELTRIADTDGDGKADVYETICDRWGLGGNYHEFVSGPVRDDAGNYYVGLGCSSSGGPVRPPLRGAPTQKTREDNAKGHHSPVPWRGWVVKISASGEFEPFASGFRQPNGLTRNLEGELFAVDNQGDWVGTSPLHHVTKGAFHGHPASLVWDDKVEKGPWKMSVKELDAMRKPPAVLFPQNDLAGSTAQPLCDTTRGKFGPYAGQLFVADWAHARMHRVALEKVDGVWQGACFPFLDGGGLRRGGNRLAWAPDGSLWIAQVSRLWGGTGEGLQRVSFTGKTPFDILAMRLRPDGFEIELTRPVDAETAGRVDAYSLQRYRYRYHSKYGSPKIDVAPVPVRSVDVAADGKTVTLRVDAIEIGFVYDLRPRGIRARNGDALAARLAAYTVNRLPR